MMSEYTVEYIGDENIIFFDLSSTCCGWTIASMERATKSAIIHKAGVLWFDDKWTHGEKYNYVCKFFLDSAYTRMHVEHCVCEAYMFNKNRAIGTAVIPELTGALKSACYETDPPLDFHMILPQTWRATLGIKKDPKFKGSAAWKKPCKKYVDNLFPNQIPQKLRSNITGKDRPVPTDLYDSLGVCLGFLSKDPNSCTKFTLSPNAFK